MNSFPTQNVTIKLRQHKSTPAQQIHRQKNRGMFIVIVYFPHDCPTLSISTSVSLLFIRGDRWLYGLGVCLAHIRLWVRVPARTFPFCSCLDICCAGVDLCCLCLIVPFWVGKLFLSYSLIYSVSLCIEQLIPRVFYVLSTGCMVPFPT